MGDIFLDDYAIIGWMIPCELINNVSSMKIKY